MNNKVFITLPMAGEYEVRKAGTTKPIITHSSIADAIQWIRQMRPDSTIFIEQPKNPNKGWWDRWQRLEKADVSKT